MKTSFLESSDETMNPPIELRLPNPPSGSLQRPLCLGSTAAGAASHGFRKPRHPSITSVSSRNGNNSTLVSDWIQSRGKGEVSPIQTDATPCGFRIDLRYGKDWTDPKTYTASGALFCSVEGAFHVSNIRLLVHHASFRYRRVSAFAVVEE